MPHSWTHGSEDEEELPGALSPEELPEELPEADHIMALEESQTSAVANGRIRKALAEIRDTRIMTVR